MLAWILNEIANWPLSLKVSAAMGVLVVVVGLFVLGLRDLGRFSLIRTWAIGTVCFQQAIRRRVLWITPLVILGVIVVSQWTKPIDAQDAVRQTTAFALFATGMLVVMVTIILACTNLPREIETRVIYTVATKPATRLEIVLGKVIGFARVSFWMLLIMGLFTWGYLHVRDWQERSRVSQRLAELSESDRVSRPTMEYYKTQGTLHARVIGTPLSVAVYAHEPKSPADRWITGGHETELMIPFVIERSLVPQGTPRPEAPAPKPGQMGPTLPSAVVPPEQMSGNFGGLMIVMAVLYQPVETADTAAPPATAPATATKPAAVPSVSYEIRDRNFYTVLQSGETGGSYRLDELPEVFNNPQLLARLGLPPKPRDREGLGFIVHHLPQDLLDRIAPVGSGPVQIYLTLLGGSPAFEYTAAVGDEQGRTLVKAYVQTADPVVLPDGRQVGHVPFQQGRLEKDGTFTPTDALSGPIFSGRSGQFGQQLKGGRAGGTRVALFEFQDQALGQGLSEYPFELRTGVESAYEDEDEAPDRLTHVELEFVNHKSGKRVKVPPVFPENNRPSYFSVPAEAVEGGDFHVLVRLKSPGWLGMRAGQNATLKLIRADQPFAWNLLKSLTILWLMSILVTVISVFTSTFLSWPIAVVLTLVILSGRWGAGQLGADLSGQSVGRQIWDQFGGKDARAARAFTESVDALVRTLEVVTGVLPDLSKFPAIQDIERGVAIPAASLIGALWVCLAFGIPLLVLSYVFLKFKEVAP